MRRDWLAFALEELAKLDAKDKVGTKRAERKYSQEQASPLPLDEHGVPCGPCPRCRMPHFHSDHDPRGWRCLHCDPIPDGAGPCDACGVPTPSA
jgi:hypothetical protein